jgi:hypothetical protein
MQKYEYSIKPDIAVVESNRDIIPVFPLGETLENYTGFPSSKISISFNVSKDFAYGVQGFQKFHYYWGQKGLDEIYYERPVGRGITLKLYLKDLLKNAKLVVNSTYFKYVRFKLDSVYPPGVHLADILIINLLRLGYAPVHCAAVCSKEEGGVLLFAPPDTGKTLTTFAALKRGFHYLAEDIAFVDSESVYANPHTATFLHNKAFRAQYAKTNGDPISSLLRKLPIFSSYAKAPALSMSRISKDFQIDQEAPIRKVVILDRGKSGAEKITKEEMARRILIINRNEFSYHKNALLFAHSYFNPAFELFKMMEKEEKIINTMVSKADCFLVKANDPKDYIDQVVSL